MSESAYCHFVIVTLSFSARLPHPTRGHKGVRHLCDLPCPDGGEK